MKLEDLVEEIVLGAQMDSRFIERKAEYVYKINQLFKPNKVQRDVMILGKNPAKVKGGLNRSEKLSPERRSEIARNAANTRHGNLRYDNKKGKWVETK